MVRRSLGARGRRAELRGMDDAEDFAALVLRRARLDGHDRPDPRLVAQQLKVGVFRAPRSLRWSELGERVRVGREVRIYVRADVAEPLRSHVIAHELGHVTVDQYGLRPERLEEWCNRFAGALLVPAPAVWSTWRRATDVARFVAAWPERAPTLLALRLGECRCADVWVTEGRRLRYTRAERPGVTRELEAAGLEAAIEGASKRLGLRAVRLLDGPRRAAVWRDEDCGEVAA